MPNQYSKQKNVTPAKNSVHLADNAKNEEASNGKICCNLTNKNA